MNLSLCEPKCLIVLGHVSMHVLCVCVCVHASIVCVCDYVGVSRDIRAGVHFVYLITIWIMYQLLLRQVGYASLVCYCSNL